jgi:hypothetical protein
MDRFRDSLASWATIVGTALGVVGLLQSRAWVTISGMVIMSAALAALYYAGRERSRLKMAAVRVEGHNIDSFNVASLRRRLNHRLVLQETRNTASIDGEDLTLTWECSGYCRLDGTAAIEFSIDTDNRVPFDELDCFAYDLRHDPERHHKIRPMLIGSDGIAKKIAVPLLAPLSDQAPFRVFLHCRLPGCMKDGDDYYTASLSFEQREGHQYSAQLTFLHDDPEWVRVYECNAGGKTRLLKHLRPEYTTDGLSEYRDTDQNVPAKGARIYFFRRDRRVRNAELKRAA